MLTKKIIAAAVALGAFIFTPNFYNFDSMPVVHAEIKTYTGIGKYIQSELVTESQARNYAKLRAEIDAKEQAGVYWHNISVTENRIEVAAISFVNFDNDVQYDMKNVTINEKFVPQYIATIHANIDTANINKYIFHVDTNVYNEHQVELKSSTKDIKDNLNKIDDLVERYNTATSQSEKKKISVEFEQVKENLSLAQKNNECIDLYNKGNYQESINFYDENIKLNKKNKNSILRTNLSKVYTKRGLYYLTDKHDYKQALYHFNKVIESKPDNSDEYFKSNLYKIYYFRAYCYVPLTEAFNKNNYSSQMNPMYTSAVNELYYKLAIKDLDKSIKLNPNNPDAYFLRGLCYMQLEKTEENSIRALDDFARAKRLEDKNKS